MTIGAICDVKNLLLVHIAVKLTAICHDCNRVGRIQPGVNC